MSKEFFNYCWSFYGKCGLYSKDFFNDTLTKQELKRAITIRTKIMGESRFHFEGDTTDREIVRDIIFLLRNPNSETEYFKQGGKVG